MAAMALRYPVMRPITIKDILADPAIDQAMETIVALHTYGFLPRPTFLEIQDLVATVAACVTVYPLDPDHPENSSVWFLGQETLWYGTLYGLAMHRYTEIFERVWPGYNPQFQPGLVRAGVGNVVTSILLRQRSSRSYHASIGDLPIVLSGGRSLSRAHRQLLNVAISWQARHRRVTLYGHVPQHEEVMIAGGIHGAAEVLAEAYPVELIGSRSRVSATSSYEAWREAIRILGTSEEHVARWDGPRSHSQGQLLLRRRAAIAVWFVQRMPRRRQLPVG